MSDDKSPELSDAAKIQQVVTWTVEGNAVVHIRESIKTQWPTADADQLIAAAETEIENAGGLHVACLRFLYQKQIEIGEFTAAARTLRDLTKTNFADKKPTPKDDLDERKRRLSDRLTQRRENTGGSPPG